MNTGSTRTRTRHLSRSALQQQNRRYRGTGGRSQENREQGFRPAFLDTETGRSYLSRFADGSPAPFHLLDGLPRELVAARTSAGQVAAALPTVVAGFLHGQEFFTRDQASAAVAA